jgi:hypothetical protein
MPGLSPIQRSTDRLLAKLDLECRELVSPTQGTTDTTQGIVQYAIYHRGIWDASAPPDSPLHRPPTPLFTANTLAEVREWLINMVGQRLAQTAALQYQSADAQPILLGCTENGMHRNID